MDLQNYPTPPPPPPVQPPPTWNGKTNGFSIAALVLSLLGCGGILAIVFGFIGLSQSRRNGDRRGRNFAVTALIICAVWIAALAAVIGIAVLRDMADGPDRDATGAIRGERSISLTDLRAGDCVKDLDDQSGSTIEVLPCATPHSSEVVGVYDLPILATDAEAEKGCEQRFKSYAKTTRKPGDKYLVFTARLKEVAVSDDTGVLCFAHQIEGTVTGSVKR